MDSNSHYGNKVFDSLLIIHHRVHVCALWIGLKIKFFLMETQKIWCASIPFSTHVLFVWVFFGTFLAHILTMIGVVTDVKPLVLVLNISHQFTCPEFAKTFSKCKIIKCVFKWLDLLFIYVTFISFRGLQWHSYPSTLGCLVCCSISADTLALGLCQYWILIQLQCTLTSFVSHCEVKTGNHSFIFQAASGSN